MIEKIFCANQDIEEESIQAVLMTYLQAGIPEATLGRMEELMVRLAGHQGTDSPKIQKPKVVVFAADHGVSVEDVSDYISEDAERWIQALMDGHFPTSALAKFSQAELEIVDAGLKADIAESSSLLIDKVDKGTANFVKQPAMTEKQLFQAILVGVESAERAKSEGCDLFVSGEIGVSNTTSALAMISVLSGKDVEELLGMGRARIMRSEQHKQKLIEEAISLHKEQLSSPMRILQHLGGFETAALCGAYIRCAQLGITIVVDGLMSTVAAWIADLISRNDQLLNCNSEEMMMDLGKYSVPETMFCICGNCPRLVEWCLFSHQSAENYHALVHEILAVEPLLRFDMKLGQASGSSLVIPLIQQACAIYDGLEVKS